METIIEYTVGATGSGKTYRRCARYILDEFLPYPDQETKLWCNYPIQFEPWRDSNGVERPGLFALAKQMLDLDEDEVRFRVMCFPKEEVATWIPKPDRAGQGVRGPWSFFHERGIALDKTHVALDEIHNFVPKALSPVQYQPWLDWLGEIRHEGATIEFLSQQPSKVHKVINEAAIVRRRIESATERRDPYFGIRLGDWFSVGTVVGRKYQTYSYQIEQRQVLDKWVTEAEAAFSFDPKYYGAYNSYNASIKGGRAGQGRQLVHEVYSKKKIVLWFLSKNLGRLMFNKINTILAFLAGILAFSLLFPYFPAIAVWLGGGKAPPKKSTASPTVASYRASVEPVEPSGQAATLEAVPVVSVVAIWGEDAVLSDGSVVKQGSSYDGKEVIAVDRATRSVQFAGGERLRMGRLRDVPAASTAASGSPGVVRASDGDGAAGAVAGRGGTEDRSISR